MDLAWRVSMGEHTGRRNPKRFELEISLVANLRIWVSRWRIGHIRASCHCRWDDGQGRHSQCQRRGPLWALIIALAFRIPLCIRVWVISDGPSFDVMAFKRECRNGPLIAIPSLREAVDIELNRRLRPSRASISLRNGEGKEISKGL